VQASQAKENRGVTTADGRKKLRAKLNIPMRPNVGHQHLLGDRLLCFGGFIIYCGLVPAVIWWLMTEKFWTKKNEVNCPQNSKKVTH